MASNRLIHEDSPYLRQHAHNPVNWFPWGDEAFGKAAAEDKPVFLSIGYSTCHWCHVMEVESFDSEEVARYLNQNFVSIKLDREQRPDLDEIYMTGLQMMTGQGGWPMSNFLTPDARPFFAGTYYPKEQFLATLQRIVEVWNTRRDDVDKQANEITQAIARYTAAKTDAVQLDEDLVSLCARELLGRFDQQHGGFGGAPKFPNESMLLVLAEDWIRNGNAEARTALLSTLDKMYQGGIYDQIAGGFHRYTVDQYWLVPHFEKMLYNQAQLARVYLQGYLLAGDPALRRVAEETVDYVVRDMRDDKGAFYSATDADSEGEEGRFFLWTPDEIDQLLDEEDATLARDLYGVTEQGNFEGRNILHLNASLEHYAETCNFEARNFFDRLQRIRRTLYEAREGRVHPMRDEKIITSWNGMMITTMALTGFFLDRDDFVESAIEAANHVWQSHYSDDEGLWRIGFHGQTSIPGNLEDYAYLAEAMLTLYEITLDRQWFERGERLVRDMMALFRDTESGGFFFSRESEQGPLILRPRSPMDGAMPSGNSVALHALVKLFRLGKDTDIETVINECLSGFAGLLKASPSSFAYMVLAAESFLRGPVSPLQFAAVGNVRVHAWRQGRNIVLEISIAPGWHINANETGDPNFPGTVLQGEALEDVSYPAGEPKSLAFQNEPVNLYEHDIRIEARLVEDVERAGLTLQLQACEDERCLSPETLNFQLLAASR